MHQPFFNEFLSSGDTLRVYDSDRLIFSSAKDRLLPIMEYIDRLTPHYNKVTIFDKIMGNAAALLSVRAGSREVYSPLGSRIAARTLEQYDIKYYLTEIVPYIQKPGGEDMCPMEKLSLGKGPEEFYEAVKQIIQQSPAAG